MRISSSQFLKIKLRLCHVLLWSWTCVLTSLLKEEAVRKVMSWAQIPCKQSHLTPLVSSAPHPVGIEVAMGEIYALSKPVFILLENVSQRDKGTPSMTLR